MGCIQSASQSESCDQTSLKSSSDVAKLNSKIPEKLKCIICGGYNPQTSMPIIIYTTYLDNILTLNCSPAVHAEDIGVAIKELKITCGKGDSIYLHLCQHGDDGNNTEESIIVELIEANFLKDVSKIIVSNKLPDQLLGRVDNKIWMHVPNLDSND